MSGAATSPAAALAARLVVGLAGPRCTRAEAAWLARWRPAGVILFARNVTGRTQLGALCRQLRALLPAEAEILADQEGGPVAVAAAALGRPPAAWGLGLVDDPELTRRVHAETGARLREAGVTRALAPVADVLVEARNPVIGARAFGADPARVARHAAAAAAGLRAGGVGCCLKHWPGHGGTVADSHERAVATAEGAQGGPFWAALAAGADAVMLGHLPVADPAEPATPATLDAAAAGRVRALVPGARPLLYADDITMGALRDAMAARGILPLGPDPGAGLVEPGALPLAWLQALETGGCDRLLCRGIPWRALPGADGPDAAISGAEFAACTPPGPDDATEDGAADAGGVYAEALGRVARAAGGDPFPSASRRLLWLDATRGDRWGDADALRGALAGRFADVRRLDVPGDCGAVAADALLVTSHRPLGAAAAEAVGAAAGSVGAGGCLALGHPSLAQDLRARLPGGWRLTALPDLAPAALTALWGG